MDEALARTREQNDKENSDLANVKERAPGRQAGRRSRADRQRAKEERMMEMDDARPAGSSTARRLRRPRSRSRSLPAAAAPLAVADDAERAMDAPRSGVLSGGSVPLALASSNIARAGAVASQSLAAPLGAFGRDDVRRRTRGGVGGRLVLLHHGAVQDAQRRALGADDIPDRDGEEVALLEREGGPVVGDGVDDAVHAREHLAVALRLLGELGSKDVLVALSGGGGG